MQIWDSREASTKVFHPKVVQQTSIPMRTIDLMAGLEFRNVSTSDVSILNRVLS
jgi:hypothetical protein